MPFDRHNQILGPVDAAFWHADSPTTPMNIGSILIFDGEIDFEGFMKMLDARLHETPLFRQRVVTTPLNIGEPMWVYDTDFYIENHVYKLQIDAPGTDEQLRQMTGRLVSSTLDRDKPLWEIYIIYGLQGNRSAMIYKVHHAMVDGMSALALFSLIMDFYPKEPAYVEKPLYDPPETPTNLTLLRDAVVKAVPRRWGLVRKLTRDAVDLSTKFISREERKKALVGLVSLINDNLTPIRRLGINGQNVGDQRLAWASFPLDTVKAIRKQENVSVNDVMLTILGTGVEKYLIAQSDPPQQEFMRLFMPVNLRNQVEDEDNVGNRIAMLPVELPFHVEDLKAKLHAIGNYTRVMKESALSKGFDMALTLPALAPAVTHGTVWTIVPATFSRLVHTWCTNVPGPQIPLYLMGLELTEAYGYFPLNPGMGMATVILSYRDQISMTLVTDAGIITDVTLMRSYLYEAFEELCQATGIPTGNVKKPAGQQRNGTTAASNQPAPKPPQPISNADTSVNASTNGHAMHGDEPVDNVMDSMDSMDDDTSAIEVDTAAAIPEAIPPQTPSTTSSVPKETIETSVINPIEEFPTPPVRVPANNGPKEGHLLSEEWAQALHKTINESRAYYGASRSWREGSLAFVMNAAPVAGYPEARAVLLDLHEGKCRRAQSIAPLMAEKMATFVLEGSYQSWREILDGKAAPLPMIMRGRLKLKKGSLRKLLPYTRSAQELVKCAMQVS